MNRPPTLIAIEHDDYSAKYVGRTADAKQFFVTTPFVPALGNNAGREFIAVYIFDALGNFLEARIDDLGTRAELHPKEAKTRLEGRISELGPINYGRIEVRPFEIDRFSTTFGLVPRPPGSVDDGWWVEAQPGNYMAFHEPWDSGEYDT